MTPKERTHMLTKASRKPRISAALSKALALHILNALTPDEAALAAGVRVTTMLDALEREHVKERLAKLRKDRKARAEQMLDLYQIEAIETAATLMRTAKSETVKMRAIEFFKRGSDPAHGPGSTVNFNAMLNPSYNYKAPDKQSDGAGGQVIDHDGE